MPFSDAYVVVVHLQPRPLPSVGLDKRFTRIDYTSTCTMRDVLEEMSRVLKVDSADLTLEAEDGTCLGLEETLADYYKQRSETRSLVACTWRQRPPRAKRQRREIRLRVRHTPPLSRRVTCTVGEDEDPDNIRTSTVRRATVQLPNTATVGELLERARSQRSERLGAEAPIYGREGELDVSLREAWVRDGCRVDHRFHVGRAVVLHLLNGDQVASFSCVMGPGDTIGDVKKRICEIKGIGMSRQSVMIRGAVQGLEDRVHLGNCCVAGASVGGFAPQGWGELHLEVCVKEPAFPLDSRLEGRDNCWGCKATEPQKPKKGFPLQDQDSDTSKNLTRKMPTAESGYSWCSHQPECSLLPAGTNVGDGLQPEVADTLSSAEAHHASAFCRPKPIFSTIVFFALSPSGRALTVRVRQDAPVADAKDVIALDEGVPASEQRLLWRGSALEPDHILLHTLGVRSGDTLILGYRIPRRSPAATKQVGTSESKIDTAVSANTGVNGSRKEQADATQAAKNGKCPVETATAVDRGSRVSASSDGTNDNRDDNASSRDIEGRDSCDDSGTVDDVVGPGNVDGIPVDAVGESGKRTDASSRRTWPFAKTMRGRGASGSRERQSNSRAGACPSAGSTSPSLSMPASTRSRYVPASAAISGSVEGAAAEPDRRAASHFNRVSARTASALFMGRVKLSGWGRWKYGRRVFAPASAPSLGGARGSGQR